MGSRIINAIGFTCLLIFLSVLMIHVPKGLTPSQRMAQSVMGRNFIGPNEAVEDLELEPDQSAIFSQVPFTEAQLKAVKDTHILMAVLPVSIMDLRRQHPQVFDPKFEGNAWYDDEPFANEKGVAQWVLVSKNIMFGSDNKSWNDQLTLLSAGAEPPSARVLVYAVTLYRLERGARLLPDILTRTHEHTADGGQVGVGFTDRGLRLGNYSPENRLTGLGILSMLRSGCEKPLK